MSDLIDEDPPDVEPSDVEPQRVPVYAPPGAPPMGSVARAAPGLSMGEIDPKIVFSGAPLTVTPSELVQLLQQDRAALHARIADIDSLLGFVSTSEDLSVRVAAIERFVGIK